MNCDHLLGRLTEHREGVLDASLCAEVERHLRECPPCATLHEDLLALSRLCRQSATPAPMPEALRARLEQMVRGSA